MSSFAILGEALIDLQMVTRAESNTQDRPAAPGYTAQPGGSPFNVAIGLARLGNDTRFVGRLAQDALGEILRRHAEQSGVLLGTAGTWPGPTPAALFDVGPDGSARYEFHLGDPRESLFAASDAVGIEADAVHFGSIASWLRGSAEPVLETVALLRDGGVFVSYDPNIRATLVRDRARTLRLVEQAVSSSDLVKASEEDLGWLYPGLMPSRIAHDWLTRGALAVVVTRGPDGATCYAAAGHVHGSSAPVQIIDTVGAGDAFMAGLLDGLADMGALSRTGLTNLLTSTSTTRHMIDTACAHAAATCAVPGADPPWRVSTVTA